jgi:hypothetical protein
MENRSSAADKRAIQAQKMRIYAAFHGALDDLIVVARDNPEDGEFGKAYAVMLRAAAEVTLVAPREIGAIAETIKQHLRTHIGHRAFRSDFSSSRIERERESLTKKMKEDLDSYQTRSRDKNQADPNPTETAAGS